MSTDDDNTNQDVGIEVEVLPPVTRDSLRAKIFAAKNTTRKTIKVPFYDAEIELRQPTVGEIEKLTDPETGKTSMVTILIDYAYVPGTDTKMFDVADAEQLTSMPFGSDMAKVADAITELTNVKVKEAEKN